MTNVYGGDEVGAVVMDIGSYSSKVGYAGEDAPRSEVSSIVAVHSVPTKIAAELDRFESSQSTGGSISEKKEKKYYIDTTEVNYPRPDQEMKSFYQDGMLRDFDLLEKMLDYLYGRHIRSKSTEHPILFSESCWNTQDVRESIAEVMFEKFQVPALYLAKNAMLAAFSTGRPTALVLDSGGTQTSAIPVIEGHVLNRSIIKTGYGGDLITGFCYKQLMEKGVEVNPTYLVKSKEAVPAGEPSRWTRRPTLPTGITANWHNYMVRKEIDNYKQCTVRIADTDYDLDEVTSDLVKVYGRKPVANYHFPDGFNVDLSVDEQFLLMEQFFNKDYQKPSTSSSTSAAEGAPTSASTAGATPASGSSLGADKLRPPLLTFPEIVLQSIAKTDIDVRPSLFSSIVLAGGNTLLPGFTDRITNELVAVAPQNLKVKVIPNNSPTERKYAAWIGGSILASLGTFQQLWISKLEYEEYGKSCIDILR